MDIVPEFENVNTAADWIRSRMPYAPRVGIILGTGLGGWTSGLDFDQELSVRDIPCMPVPHVVSHTGKLGFTRMHDIPVLISSSRVHYYEGYTMAEVARQIRVMKTIGCTHLIITNAAGGLHPAYHDGDIVLIRDHISLMPDSPLRGPNEPQWGPRFPDMKEAYDPAWRLFVQEAAAAIPIRLHTGVYAGNPGPALETPAEYEYLFRIGADLVGMSAVPEVQAAVHIGLNVLGISVVSNVCYPPERITETTVEEVIRVVEASAPEVGALASAAVRFLLL